jgi:hypothetical protein
LDAATKMRIQLSSITYNVWKISIRTEIFLSIIPVRKKEDWKKQQTQPNI